jgi:hypothetical protein
MRKKGCGQYVRELLNEKILILRVVWVGGVVWV